ncbi:hypothetical protein ACFE04_004910 [Oxalis oulophora]
MADQERSCCQCCCSTIATLGLTALFMWLSLRTTNPSCSIENFYIPSLNNSLNTPKNNTLYYSLRLKNTNKDKGVYYDNINLSFYYKANETLLFNSTVNGFHQGHDKKATKSGNASVVGVDREEVFRAVSVNGSAVFRVDMVTKVRFEILGLKTKRHTFKVGGNIMVNGEGTKVDRKKGVKLKSGVEPVLRTGPLRVLLLLWSLLFIFLS